MTYNYATDNGATDDTDYVYYPETGNTSTLQISGSIDAAAASLQLGTDREETQVIEMGSQDVTTTIYGTVTLVHAVNASAIAVTHNLVVGGKATLTNASVTTMDVGALGVGALQVNGLTTCTGQLFVGADNQNDTTGQTGGVITLGGTYGDPSAHSKIFTRLYGAGYEKSEMVMYKGNDTVNTSGQGSGSKGPDRIRLRTPHVQFDARGDDNYSNETTVMTVNASGVWIGKAPDTDLDIPGFLYVTGNCSLQNISSTNVQATTLTATTLTATNLSSTTLQTNTLQATGQTLLQNTSITSLTVTGNASIKNASVSVLDATTLTTTQIKLLGLGSTILEGTLDVTGFSKLTNVSMTSLVTTNSSLENVSVTKLQATAAQATTLVATSLFATNSSLENVSVSKLQASVIQASTVSVTSFSASTSNVDTLNVSGDTTLLGTLTVGRNNTSNVSGQLGGQINLAGTVGDGTGHCKIYTRLYDAAAERSELVLFKGAEGAGAVGPDRIRFKSNEFVFDDLGTLTDDVNVSNIKMVIKDGGNVGIGTFTPGSTLDVNGSLNVSGITKIATSSSSLFNYAPTCFASFNASRTNGILGVAQDFPTIGDNTFTLSDVSGGFYSYQPVQLLAGKKYIVTLRAYGTGVVRYRSSNTVDMTNNTLTLTSSYATYTNLVVPTTTVTRLFVHLTGAANQSMTWSSLTVEPYYDLTLGSDLLSLGGNINVSMGSPVTDWHASRLVFQESTTRIGNDISGHRMAYGGNSYVVMYDGNASVASFVTTIDGLNWSNPSTLLNTSRVRGLAYGVNAANASIFVALSHESPTKVWSSANGLNWTPITPVNTSGPFNTPTDLTFGNGLYVACANKNTSNIITSTDATNWTVRTPFAFNILGVGYGVVSGVGTFVACGPNVLYRNVPTGSVLGSWTAGTPTQTGNWAYVGFGNNTFLVTSDDATGKLTQSTNGGVTWTTLSSFNEAVQKPVYVEGSWIVGSATGVYVSKDNGVTWAKRTGNGMTTGIYGGKLVTTNVSSLSLVSRRNQRTDGTNLTYDTISIGREGSTTIVGADMVVSGNASLANATLQNVSMTGTLAVIGNVSMNNVSCTGLSVSGTIDATYGLFSTTTVNGTLKSNTIEGIATTGTQSLYATKTAGTLNIATSQTAGSISIGGSGSSLGITSTNMAIYSTDVYIAGPLAVGSTNKNAIANFIGTSAQPVSVACRPFNSDTSSLIDFYNVAGGTRGQVLGTGSGNVAYQTSSDRRLKTNIEPLDPMLDKVMSLKPSKYNWKEDNLNGYGFIAQEVYEVFPQLRNRTPSMCGCIDEPCDEDGKPIHYGLDYGQFTPYIVKALQEMKQEYDAKLAALEARLSALERT